MSIAVIVAFAAAAGFFLLLSAAVLVWRLRSDREEETAAPARPSRLGASARPRLASPYPDLDTVRPSPHSVPEEEPIRSSSVVSRLIGSLAPDLAALSDIVQAAGRIQAEDGGTLTEEERRRAMLQAIEDLAEREPGNRMLQSMRASLTGLTGEPGEMDAQGGRVQVFRAGGEVHIVADGVEYPDADSLPDARMRTEARKLLDLLDIG